MAQNNAIIYKKYVPQVWNTGDVITDQKLNHIEDGLNKIINSPDVGKMIVVDVIPIQGTNNYELNLTFNEALALINAGNLIACKEEDQLTGKVIYDYITQINTDLHTIFFPIFTNPFKAQSVDQNLKMIVDQGTVFQ